MLTYLSSHKPKTKKEKSFDRTCRDNERVWIRMSTGRYYVAFPDGCGGVQYENLKQAMDEETAGFCSPPEGEEWQPRRVVKRMDKEEQRDIIPPKRKRGRPKGSKNKPVI